MKTISKKEFIETYGGNSDAIYDFDVDFDTEITIRDLDPFSGTLFSNNLIGLINFNEYFLL